MRKMHEIPQQAGVNASIRTIIHDVVNTLSNVRHRAANNFRREERESNEGKMYSRVSNLRLRLLEQSVV